MSNAAKIHGTAPTGRERDALRNEIHAALMENSRKINHVDLDLEPSRARDLIGQRRNLRAQYESLRTEL